MSNELKDVITKALVEAEQATRVSTYAEMAEAVLAALTGRYGEPWIEEYPYRTARLVGYDVVDESRPPFGAGGGSVFVPKRSVKVDRKPRRRLSFPWKEVEDGSE